MKQLLIHLISLSWPQWRGTLVISKCISQILVLFCFLFCFRSFLLAWFLCFFALLFISTKVNNWLWESLEKQNNKQCLLIAQDSPTVCASVCVWLRVLLWFWFCFGFDFDSLFLSCIPSKRWRCVSCIFACLLISALNHNCELWTHEYSHNGAHAHTHTHTLTDTEHTCSDNYRSDYVNISVWGKSRKIRWKSPNFWTYSSKDSQNIRTR